MPRRRTVLATLLAAGAALAIAFGPGCGREPGPPTVVLISLDTLRPERLGVYGNDPQVSPAVDALARRAVVFEQALANSPYTLPSHMTMLTGMDPVAHGVKRDGDVLSSRVTTLAEALAAAGFQCGAFTDGGFVSSRYGFPQGFHVFDDKRDWAPEGAVNGMRRILPRALDWLDAQGEQPLFLFVHTFDAHAPFQDGDPQSIERFRAREAGDGPRDHELFRLRFLHQMNMLRIPEYGRMAELLNDYDAGVHDADAGVAAILDWLEAHGRLQDALVIVTSDHGESFADHGIHVGHGIGLTDDEIHVPLVLKLPGDEAAGRRVNAAVDLTDLAPTVLDVMGVPVPAEMQGESLLGALRGQARRRRHVFGTSPNTETYFLVMDGFKLISPPAIMPDEVARRHLGPVTPPNGGLGGELGDDYEIGPPGNRVALRYDFAGDPIGIRDTILTGVRLFDRRADPGELRNLAAEDPQREKRMSQALREAMEASIALHEQVDDGTTVAQGEAHVDQTLAALGYLGAGNADEARASLAELPAAQRLQLERPYVPPDHAALHEADKVMQFVRTALEDGRQPKGRLGEVLQEQGEALVEWALDNPAHWAKVGWRLHELVGLSERAGVPIDPQRWKARFAEWAREHGLQRPVEEPAGDGTGTAGPGR